MLEYGNAIEQDHDAHWAAEEIAYTVEVGQKVDGDVLRDERVGPGDDSVAGVEPIERDEKAVDCVVCRVDTQILVKVQV